jgi:hypothetical protein
MKEECANMGCAHNAGIKILLTEDVEIVHFCTENKTYQELLALYTRFIDGDLLRSGSKPAVVCYCKANNSFFQDTPGCKNILDVLNGSIWSRMVPTKDASETIETLGTFNSARNTQIARDFLKIEYSTLTYMNGLNGIDEAHHPPVPAHSTELVAKRRVGWRSADKVSVRVLLVDDHAATVLTPAEIGLATPTKSDTIKVALKHIDGLNVYLLEAATIESAIAILGDKGKAIDLILLDYHLGKDSNDATNQPGPGLITWLNGDRASGPDIQPPFLDNRYWIFPISSFTNAFDVEAASGGAPRIGRSCVVATGVDPVCKPRHFALEFERFLYAIVCQVVPDIQCASTAHADPWTGWLELELLGYAEHPSEAAAWQRHINVLRRSQRLEDLSKVRYGFVAKDNPVKGLVTTILPQKVEHVLYLYRAVADLLRMFACSRPRDCRTMVVLLDAISREWESLEPQTGPTSERKNNPVPEILRRINKLIVSK